MRNSRSAAQLLAASFVFGALCASCAAQAQTTGTGIDGKRVQVLKIIESRAGKATPFKKFRSVAATARKSKVARNAVRLPVPTVGGAAKNQMAGAESPGPTVESAAPEETNSLQASMEQTGALAFSERAVAFASFANEGGSIVSQTESVLRDSGVQAINNPGTEKPMDANDQEIPQSRGRSPLIYHVLAIFCGAVLVAFGVVNSRGGRTSPELLGMPVVTPFDRA